jgi:hypothetical protein
MGVIAVHQVSGIDTDDQPTHSGMERRVHELGGRREDWTLLFSRIREDEYWVAPPIGEGPRPDPHDDWSRTASAMVARGERP